MYKVIKIKGKEYKLEYTVEASLYEDCASSVSDIMADIFRNSEERDVKGLMGTMARVPQKAIIVFYAGLLEYHGPEGDGTVTSLETGKELCKEYLKEQGCNWYDILNMCMEQMGEDGFFKLVGLDAMFATVKEDQEEETPKEKKKIEKVSESK